MAIGLGRMFGFDFKENFQLPVYSSSIQNFGEDGIFHFQRGLKTMYIFH